MSCSMKKIFFTAISIFIDASFLQLSRVPGAFSGIDCY